VSPTWVRRSKQKMGSDGMACFARGSNFSICTHSLMGVPNRLRMPRKLHLNSHLTAHRYGYFTVSVNMVLLLNEPELPARLRL
jgi:hypothetical protein